MAEVGDWTVEAEEGALRLSYIAMRVGGSDILEGIDIKRNARGVTLSLWESNGERRGLFIPAVQFEAIEKFIAEGRSG